MKILKTMVSFSDLEDGSVYKMDTIEYQGKLWLVPEWTVDRVAGLTRPTRIICLDPLPHQKTPGGPSDFVLNYGIPKSVCIGSRIAQEDLFVVIESPDITVEPQNDDQ